MFTREKKAQEDKERQEREEKANPTMTTQNSRWQTDILYLNINS